MATTTSITTTYAGEFAGQYVAASLLEAKTLSQGGITIKPNVKFKEVLKKLSLDGIVKDATCDFADTSTITLTERILIPEEQQVNLQICKADFASDWEAVQMGYSAYHDVPPTFADFVLGHIAAKVAERTELSIWSGDTASNGQFDGFTKKLGADADLPAANEVAGTTVTAANVIVELGKIVDAIPSSLYGSEGLFIYVSQNIARAYVRALGGFASVTQQNAAADENVGVTSIGGAGVNSQGTMWYQNGGLMVDGVKIFVANGLADNKAIATTKDNLFFGTGLISDHNEVKLLDMADLDGSQNARIIMRFTAGVEYANVEDIVTYGITNSAN
tara:strand:+ start:230 stop:1225 length:996 start_codon:yes stop_codon:yes gene_type:complete